jgi:hypothetical protein
MDLSRRHRTSPQDRIASCCSRYWGGCGPVCERLAESLAERIPKFFERRGLGPESDAEESDPLARDEPWLARLYAASISGRAAFGAKAGRPITRMGDRIDPETIEALASPRCASVDGFSLHANVSVPAHDRSKNSRLSRSALACASRLATPALSSGALQSTLADKTNQPYKAPVCARMLSFLASRILCGHRSTYRLNPWDHQLHLHPES